MAANTNAHMNVLFTTVSFGCAKVKISCKIDNDARQLKEFTDTFRAWRLWPVTVCMMSIKEEPDRTCLPVPRPMLKVFEESFLVHLILPDLLEQAGNDLIRRCVIHVRKQNAQGIVDAESICNQV